MTLIQQKQQAERLLSHMKELADSLNKHMEPIAALNEIFSELDNAAAVGIAATRSAKCFARV